MFKKLLAGLVVLLVLLLAAVLVAPGFIDWNQHKDRIAAEVETATGRALTITGDLSMTLLPLPTLSAEGLTLANIEGGSDEAMISLESLDVRIAFWPLLRGEVKVSTISLIRPVVVAEILADGRNNWTFAQARAPERDRAGTEPALPEAAPRTGPPLPSFSLDNLEIRDGIVIYRDHGAGTEEIIEAVDAEVSAESLSGPVRARGRAKARGLMLGFDLSLGRWDEDRALPLNVRVNLPGENSEARFVGLLSRTSQGPSLRGKLTAQTGNVARVGRLLAPGVDIPDLLARDFRMDGAVIANPERVTVSDIETVLGGMTGTGNASVVLNAVPGIDLTLSLGRLMLDDWTAAPAERRGGGNDGTRRGRETERSAEPAVPRDGGFALPDAFAADLDISVEAIVWQGGVINNARLNATLADGEVTLNQVAALLPGGSEVSLFGFLGAEDGHPFIEAGFETSSANLRAVLDWLRLTPPDISPDRLRRFSARGDIKGTTAQFQVLNLDVELDGAVLNGAATIRPAPRFAMGVSLAAESFNLDAYLPRTETAPRNETRERQTRETPDRDRKDTPQPLKALSALNDFDASMNVRIGALTVHGMTLRDVFLDGVLAGGKLTLDEASVGDALGGSAKFAGGLSGFGGSPRFDGFVYDLRTRQPERLARHFDLALPFPPAQLGSVAMSGTLDGDADTLRLDTRNEVAGTVINLAGDLEDLFGRRTMDLDVEAGHSSLRALLRLLAPSYQPASEDLGGFALSSRLRGDMGEITLEDLRARAGTMTLAGEASLGLDAPRPKLSAVLNANDMTVDPFLPARRAAKNPGLQRLAPENALLRRASFTGGPGFGGAGMRGRSASGLVPVQAQAGTPWSTQALNLSGLRLFDADIALTAAALTWRTYRIENPDLAVTLGDGKAVLDRLTGRVFGGDVSATGRLLAPENPTAKPSAALTLGIESASVRDALFTASAVDVVDGLLNLDFSLESTGASPLELVSGLNGAGEMLVLDGVLRGFDLDAISRSLSELGASPTNLVALLQGGLSGGSTRFESLRGAFDISEGRIRSDDITLDAAAGSGRATLTADLPRWTIDADARFTVAAMPDAPPLRMRLTGALDDPRRVIDFDAFQAHVLSRGIGRALERLLPQQPPRPAAPAVQPPPETDASTEPSEDTTEPPPAEEQPAPPREASPEDFIRDILRSLQR